MRSRRLGLAVAFVTLGMLLVAQAQSQPAQKGSNLKILVPQSNAKLTIDQVPIKVSGEERNVILPPLAAGKDSYTVSVFWEPNNYTKITRTWKVAAKPGSSLVVDMRKQDLKQPDDIVVRYVPTPPDVVEAMCKLAKVSSEDVVYDLGCGDGRLVITAVKLGAKRGVGVDLDAKLVKQSQANAKKQGVSDKVEFRVGDVLKIPDLKDANVVLLYMGDDINLRLRPILQKTLKPGSRIVSHRFTMGDWKPDVTEKMTGRDGDEYLLHLWTIKPAITNEKK